MEDGEERKPQSAGSGFVASLRVQDWAAVTVQLVILVLGIFLGLQADNWNSERELDAQRSAAIERLHEESEQAVAYFRGHAASLDRRNTWRDQALRRLTSGDWEGANREQIEQGLLSVAMAPAVAPPRSVYDELISTGLFAEIGDAEAREAVTRYYAKVDFLTAQIAYVRDINVANVIGRQFDGIRMVYDPDQRRRLRAEIDLARLGTNSAYFEFVLTANATQLSQAEWWHEVLADAETMCAQTARIGGRPCEPPDDAEPGSHRDAVPGPVS